MKTNLQSWYSFLTEVALCGDWKVTPLVDLTLC